MAKNDMQKIWKRWNGIMRGAKLAANEDDRKSFLFQMNRLKESIDRFESKMLTEDSDGFKQIKLL